MDLIRTPEECFSNLDDYNFEPHYADVSDVDGQTVRMHYLDEGPGDGEVVLCLHGNPSWSYLYRKMIPVFVEAGYRVLVPDLIGFGRSDKPTLVTDHTYSQHENWLSNWFESMDVDCNLFCQDWGGLIGLRLVAKYPQRFRRVMAGNTSLPDGTKYPESKALEMRALYDRLPVVKTEELFHYFVSKNEAPGYWYWRKYCAESPDFRIATVLQNDPTGYVGKTLEANEAPYPDDRYLAGPRGFPSMAPIFPDDPELKVNQEVWKRLGMFERPFTTAFADDDYVAAPGDQARFHERIPGAQGNEPIMLGKMGHFLRHPSVAETMIDFMQSTKVEG